MDIKYITLFGELAKSSEIIAEQVMELDRAQNDEKGEATAKIMRDDYSQLYDKLSNGDSALTKNEFAKLLVAAFIIVNNLDDKIKKYQQTVDTYKTQIIPKLQRLIDEPQTDEEVIKLADEIFSE